MTLQQEIVTELRSLAAWFREISRITHMPCTSELNLKRADKWGALAAKVEAARCETCEQYFVVTGKDGEVIPCPRARSGGCWNYQGRVSK